MRYLLTLMLALALSGCMTQPMPPVYPVNPPPQPQPLPPPPDVVVPVEPDPGVPTWVQYEELAGLFKTEAVTNDFVDSILGAPKEERKQFGSEIWIKRYEIQNSSGTEVVNLYVHYDNGRVAKFNVR